MKNSLLLCVLVLSAAFLAGCAQSGMFMSANLTNTELGEANYRIVATNVTGTSSAAYLLGVSYSYGGTTSALAFVRVQGTGLLYQEALADLWKNYEEKHGSVEGKKLSLVNVRYDSDHINLFLYTSATVSIRADVVEFLDK